MQKTLLNQLDLEIHMHQFNYLWATMLSLAFTSSVFAQDATSILNNVENQDTNALEKENSNSTSEEENIKSSRFQALKELKNIHLSDLKVNANAAQADEVKDPLQGLNREIYKFNDSLDRNIARPLAVQYNAKVPVETRTSYRLFRKNMLEPWNAVNQLVQGRPIRAAKSLGRFTINTLTSLGLADPARRLGLNTEEETMGNTLGYYGVPSGPYLMLPILGPSTLRNSLDYVTNAYATPTNHILSNNDQYGIEWSNAALGGIDSRSQFLDIDGSLRGDRYAALRDIYLQRKNFEIAEKKGNNAEAIGFIDDDLGDDIDEDQIN